MNSQQPPEEAIDSIVAYMARRGFVVSRSGPASATFTRNKWPNWQMLEVGGRDEPFRPVVATRLSLLLKGRAAHPPNE